MIWVPFLSHICVPMMLNTVWRICSYVNSYLCTYTIYLARVSRGCFSSSGNNFEPMALTSGPRPETTGAYWGWAAACGHEPLRKWPMTHHQLPALIHQRKHHLECPSEDLILLADLPWQGSTGNCRGDFMTNVLPAFLPQDWFIPLFIMQWN